MSLSWIPLLLLLTLLQLPQQLFRTPYSRLAIGESRLQLLLLWLLLVVVLVGLPVVPRLFRHLVIGGTASVCPRRLLGLNRELARRHRLIGKLGRRGGRRTACCLPSPL